jgi:hypothetical protein
MSGSSVQNGRHQRRQSPSETVLTKHIALCGYMRLIKAGAPRPRFVKRLKPLLVLVDVLGSVRCWRPFVALQSFRKLPITFEADRTRTKALSNPKRSSTTSVSIVEAGNFPSMRRRRLLRARHRLVPIWSAREIVGRGKRRSPSAIGSQDGMRS